MLFISKNCIFEWAKRKINKREKKKSVGGWVTAAYNKRKFFIFIWLKKRSKKKRRRRRKNKWNNKNKYWNISEAINWRKIWNKLRQLWDYQRLNVFNLKYMVSFLFLMMFPFFSLSFISFFYILLIRFCCVVPCF